MNIHIEESDGTCRMKIEGEMTIFNAAELKKQLIDCFRQSSGMELDLSGVSEMDTAGLQLLLLVYRDSSNADKSVRLTSYSPAVSAVFDLFRMDKEAF